MKPLVTIMSLLIISFSATAQTENKSTIVSLSDCVPFYLYSEVHYCYSSYFDDYGNKISGFGIRLPQWNLEEKIISNIPRTEITPEQLEIAVRSILFQGGVDPELTAFLIGPMAKSMKEAAVDPSANHLARLELRRSQLAKRLLNRAVIEAARSISLDTKRISTGD